MTEPGCSSAKLMLATFLNPMKIYVFANAKKLALFRANMRVRANDRTMTELV